MSKVDITKPTGKEFFKKFLKPNCISCKHSSECTEEVGNCNFEVVSETEILNRILIAEDTLKNPEISDEDARQTTAELEDLEHWFGIHYNGSRIDIDDFHIDHKVCPMCDGSGVTLGSGSIEPCNRCHGSGIIDTLYDLCYEIRYVVYDKLTYSHDVVTGLAEITVYGIYNDLKDALVRIGKMAPGIEHDALPHEFTFARMLVHGNLKDAKLLHGGSRLTVIDKMTGNVVAMGDWFHIHDEMKIPDFIDITTVNKTPDNMMRYDCLVSSEMNLRYTIVDNRQMNILYNHLFSDITSTYLPNASYKDAELLLAGYTQIHSTHDDICRSIIANAQSDMTFTIEYETVTIAGLDKIVDDFKLFGIRTANRHMAANVVYKLCELAKSNEPLRAIGSFNAVAVFIVEYILISGEYNEISDVISKEFNTLEVSS